MSELAGGNVLGALSSNPRNTSTAIPGYRLGKATGYAALKTTLDNRFSLYEVPSKKTESAKPLKLPMSSRVYGVGYRAGAGLWNEAGGDYLHLSFNSDGAYIPSVSACFNSIAASSRSEIAPGIPLPPSQYPQGRLNGAVFAAYNGISPVRDYRHSAQFMGDHASLDGSFATPINNMLDSGFGIQGMPPEYHGDSNGQFLEIQIKDGFSSGSNLVPALGHGLRQNLDPIFQNQGYLIVDVYYIMRDWEVSESENLNIAWDEVFKYVF